MNKRIKKIWEDSEEIKVRYPEQGSPVSVSEQTLEKFAELIVRDCLYIIYERKDQAIDMDWNVDEAMSCAAMHIAENFGLQE
jgi:hypothetical protein